MEVSSLPGIQIRRWYHYREATYSNEAGVAADGPPVIKIVVGALLKNPAIGRVSPAPLDDVVADSQALGEQFARLLVADMGAHPIASYGKACVVGVDGEYEHGNAFLTETFMVPVRAAIGGGKAWVPSTGKRGGPGTAIDIPLANKDALYVRSQYDTVTVMFPDGPNADEVLVLVAAASRGRLHARLGGLALDEVKGEDGLR